MNSTTMLVRFLGKTFPTSALCSVGKITEAKLKSDPNLSRARFCVALTDGRYMFWQGEPYDADGRELEITVAEQVRSLLVTACWGRSDILDIDAMKVERPVITNSHIQALLNELDELTRNYTAVEKPIITQEFELRENKSVVDLLMDLAERNAKIQKLQRTNLSLSSKLTRSRDSIVKLHAKIDKLLAEIEKLRFAADAGQGGEL